MPGFFEQIIYPHDWKFDCNLATNCTCHTPNLGSDGCVKNKAIYIRLRHHPLGTTTKKKRSLKTATIVISITNIFLEFREAYFCNESGHPDEFFLKV